MARVPVITSPCPLRWKTMPSAGADFCAQCQRRVHNLDGMNDAERQTFFASCSGEVCVAYTVHRPRAIAGAIGLGVAVALTTAASATAQESVPTVVTGPTCDPYATIVVGGTTKARDVVWVDEREAALPDAPLIGEIDAAAWLPVPDSDSKPRPR